jgi:glutaredoxin
MDNEIIIYGTTWCYDTFRARKVFDKNHIAYKWIDIDKDPEGRGYVEQVNHGNRSVPTILFPDGSLLVEPGEDELAAKLGLKQKA